MEVNTIISVRYGTESSLEHVTRGAFQMTKIDGKRHMNDEWGTKGIDVL